MVPAHWRAGPAWHDDENALAAWRAGRTGIPIVDAGMRQLAGGGFMHNRARMITASFLTRNLGVDWRHGYQHFGRLLADGDPATRRTLSYPDPLVELSHRLATGTTSSASSVRRR